MQLPRFKYVEPESLKDAVQFLQEYGRQSIIIGGGTDILPSMKQRIYIPEYIVSLDAIADLKQIEFSDNFGVKLGPSLRLCSLEADPMIQERFPMLAQAAGEVGSPQLKEMGTLGGNLCLDTRCYYYNQSDTWRNCKPTCLKMGGKVCNVVKSSKKCFAVFSSDLAPALIALDARIVLLSSGEERTIPLHAFYTGDGIKPLTIKSNEILIRVEIPFQRKDAMGIYLKYRIRKSIDFPLAGVAISLWFEGSNKVCRDVNVVIGAVNTRPTKVNEIRELLEGKTLDDTLIEKASQLAYKIAKPVSNTADKPSHRKRMIEVLVKRAFNQVLQGCH